MLRFHVLPLGLIVASAFTIAGCSDQQVASYRVKKEEAPATPPAPEVNTKAAPAPQQPPQSSNAGGPSMASTPVRTAEGSGLTWTAPAHWTAKPPSAMRRGSYTVEGKNGAKGDMAITAFPGSVGGNLANVNRWRGQINLPPITEAELERTLAHHDFNGLHMDVVDITSGGGGDPQRILGAIVPFGEATWFFKLSGPDSLLGAEKSAFMTFLQSVKAP